MRESPNWPAANFTLAVLSVFGIYVGLDLKSATALILCVLGLAYGSFMFIRTTLIYLKAE